MNNNTYFYIAISLIFIILFNGTALLGQNRTNLGKLYLSELETRSAGIGLAVSNLEVKLTTGKPTPDQTASPFQWIKLKTEPFRGKQDDVFFINEQIGWYVNGSGKIYKSTDGGASWTEKLNKPGTYFRAVGFVDEMRGFAGNIGTGYFPNVSDTTPLYETADGGETWKPVEGVNEKMIKGICAIEIVKKPFINAGKLDYKTYIYVGGRVGGPALLIKSEDGGETWQSIDMSQYCAMILDVKFFDSKNGVISAASSADVEKSNALILTTADGGKTWTKRYQSKRPYELTWKSSFPTRQIGYITIQNYNPDKTVSQRYIAKTINGGKTWKEIPLVDDHNFREFGVGFIDRNTGWVGGSTGGYETVNGGKTWKPVKLGNAVNKIKLLKTNEGFVGYAIGVDLYKLDYRKR